MTYDEYAAELGLTLELEARSGDRHGWMLGSSHWTATIRNADGETMTVPFSAGPAVKAKPTVGDVLMAVALDASSYDNADDWRGWAEDFGLETGEESEARKARRDYEACGREAAGLLRLLGGGEYQRLLWSGEVSE